MKAFSKEWWLKKGLGVRPVGLEIGTCFKRSIKQQHTLAMFCFKRYAEAHHREKMAFTESPLMTMHKKGQEAERKKILGIIEEMKGMYSQKNPFESAALMLINDLTQKIKGE